MFKKPNLRPINSIFVNKLGANLLHASPVLIDQSFESQTCLLMLPSFYYQNDVNKLNFVDISHLGYINYG